MQAIRMCLLVGVWAVYVLIVLGAIMKMGDLSGFSHSLESWTLLVPELRAPVAIGVPLVELCVAECWFLGLHRGAVTVATAGLLAAFTAFYLAHLATGQKPTCSCFGATAAHETLMDSATLHVARNLVMLAIVLGASVIDVRGEVAIVPRRPNRRVDRPTVAYGARAFTLLELLIVIAIVALVVSILVPALRAVKEEGLVLRSLSNLRAHAQTMTTYSGDEQEAFPFLTEPTATATILRGGNLVVPVPFFGLYLFWNVGLADGYYGGDPTSDVFAIPWAGRVRSHTGYWYSDCFISRPEFWDPETRLADGSQLRATRQADVVFPSQKGVVYENGRIPASGSRWESPGGMERFALVDGSAGEYRPGDLRQPYPRGSVVGVPTALQLAAGFPVMATIDGVRGRDF